ncbi:toll/interleukin-1 receptor domain-containing protein [Pseudoalteromonas sp. NEC-BIFX-2020_015]|uniref:toll/interleukin-1 receptor domain-containing protein n=1 Tax=Pseudoalteromonas sp. NEC-BIFX-2020_015 TaxID=2729544 RepID=UPI0014615F18|nr:toll/interleukin-1 receptor domain-containing protein [Pseudoalteromonas sp. NEC-BIFX-2020_015]NMR24331.1 toll/interleukin-1 receptor domain-containing protein [Pseudoalteromonas sp. NEC-BIFX-2020_015]
MHPKVFVSHASEDKERFVTEFSTKLRENGVDAWLDKWEMLPGDSLVDKIFEEGLKDAQAVIIVLSNFSVKKPWVREELNAGIVSKLSKGTKIIPIVLDSCDVPQSLTSTLWESISDLNDYDSSFKRVLSSIFGTTDKPALGKTPAHTSSVYNEIGGLTKADNLILKESCQYIIENGHNMVDPDSLLGNGDKLGFSHSEIKDCIEVLEQNGYLDVSRYMGGGINSYMCHYSVTTYGLHNYVQSYLPDYSETSDKVVSLIVNEGINNNKSLQEKTSKPIMIINHILNALESNDHIQSVKTLDGTFHITNVSASLRRALA